MTDEVKSEMLRCANGAIFDWNVGVSYVLVRVGNKVVRVYETPALMHAFIKAGYHGKVFMDEAIRLIGRGEAIIEPTQI